MADISLTLDIAGGGDEPYASGIVKVRRNTPGVGSGGYVDGSWHDIPLSNPPTVLGLNGFDPLEQGVYYDFLLPGLQVPITLLMPNTSSATFSALAPVIPPVPIPNLIDDALAVLLAGPSQSHDAVVGVADEAERTMHAGSVTYNGDGTVLTSTDDGIVTTYTYNGDGTLNTEARGGKTTTYAYTSGVLTGWSVA